MKIIHYTEKSARDVLLTDLDNLLEAKDGTVWVDMTGPTEEDVRVMREVFKFHPLAIEDTLNQEQRPKAEEYSDHLFLIMNPATDDGHTCTFKELDIFVGRNYVVTVHGTFEPAIEQASKRLDPARLALPVSTTYLLYMLLDTIVDNYFPLIDRIEDELGELSNNVLTKPSQKTLNRIFQLKNTLSMLWRVLWPQRDILNVLMNHNLTYIDKDVQYYLRDVSDHLKRLGDQVHFFSDTLAGLVNLYASAVSNSVNVVVHRLTVFAVIIGILTVIGGFYGMNFTHTWPPFDASWGVPFVMVLMAVTIGVCLVVLRRRE